MLQARFSHSYLCHNVSLITLFSESSIQLISFILASNFHNYKNKVKILDSDISLLSFQTTDRKASSHKITTSLPAIGIDNIADLYAPHRYDIDCRMYRIIKSNCIKNAATSVTIKYPRQNLMGDLICICCCDYSDFLTPLHRVNKLTNTQEVMYVRQCLACPRLFDRFARIFHECLRRSFFQKC